MDIASIIGIALGFGCLLFGYSMDGGGLKSLVLLSAFIIVIGGSLGSAALSFGISELKNMPKMMIRAFKPPKSKIGETIDFIVKLSEIARKDGLLSIEKSINENNMAEQLDPLLYQGILMVIDGVDLEQIRDTLETQIYVFEEKSKNEIAIFDALGGYAPTYGMIGTIMGMIKVLANLENAEEMAASIAVAFTATLYGVASANVLYLPIASKLKLRLKQSLLEKEMIIEGVCSIRNGMNSKMLRDKLSIYSQEENSQKSSDKNKKVSGAENNSRRKKVKSNDDAA